LELIEKNEQKNDPIIEACLVLEKDQLVNDRVRQFVHADLQTK
jgi:hypothetical protein